MVLKLWDKIGALDELDSINVLTQHYTSNESFIKSEPENTEASHFFSTLLLKNCNKKQKTKECILKLYGCIYHQGTYPAMLG